MKILQIIALIGLMTPSICSGQNEVIDSLEQILPTAKPGWDRGDVLLGLARLYINTDQKKRGRAHLLEIHKISKEFDIPELKAYALIIQNVYTYLHENNADKAIEECNEAIEIAKRTNCQDALIYASYQLAENYLYEKGDWEMAEQILLKAVDGLTDEVGDKSQGAVLRNLGYIYGNKGEYEKAMSYYRKAVSILIENVNNPRIDPRIGRISALNMQPQAHVTYTLNAMGDLEIKRGNFDEALKFKKQALEQVQSINFDVDIAWMNNEIAQLYNEMGDYVSALSFLQKSRAYFESQEIKRDLAECNSVMISLLSKLEDYAEAEKVVNNNIAYYLETKDSIILVRTYMQAVDIQIGLNRYEEALALADKAEHLAHILQNLNVLALINSTRGHIYIKTGQLDKAEKHFRSAIDLFKQHNHELGAARAEYNLADTYLKNRKPDSASVYSQKALKRALDINDRGLVSKAYLLMSNIHEAQNNHKMALNNYKSFFAYHDSIYTADAQAKLKEEQVRQNVVEFKKEKELAEINARLLQDRNKTFLISGIVLIVMLIVAIYFYYNLRKIKGRIEEQNIQLTQLNQTKDKFFGIIAHDLRSPLLGLQSVGEQIDYLINKNQTDRLKDLSSQIESTAKKLTDLLDNLLNWALLQNGMIPYQPERISLNQAIDTVIELFSPTAEMKGVKISNELKEQIFVYADDKAVQTIIRNIVSNAIKFTNKDGMVSLSVEVKNDKAIIKINDTGTGISAETLPKLFELNKKSIRGTIGEKGAGLGLVLCKELVEMNKGKIEVVSDVGKGSSIIFDLPMLTNAA